MAATSGRTAKQPFWIRNMMPPRSVHSLCILPGHGVASEARSEYGPPVLSKLPYINRLFKNVAYGRETESLLIMVTPRIIIQEEEEERQTGLRTEPTVIP